MIDLLLRFCSNIFSQLSRVRDYDGNRLGGKGQVELMHLQAKPPPLLLQVKSSGWNGYSRQFKHGIDVRITSFCDFLPIFSEKIGVFLKTLLANQRSLTEHDHFRIWIQDTYLILSLRLLRIFALGKLFKRGPDRIAEGFHLGTLQALGIYCVSH
jgi:hypothetical protein